MSDRLHRTESVLNASTEVRIGIGNWLGGMLRRPPLARPDPGWEGVRAFVEAAWWDVADLTPDPDSPIIEGLGIVPVPHERLLELHPWNGEESGASA